MEENKVNDLSSTAVKKDSRTKMITGSAWMTAGSITSRILGALYIIPWVTWLGAYSNEANALYAQGYNIYNMFLVIATGFLLQFLKWSRIITE